MSVLNHQRAQVGSRTASAHLLALAVSLARLDGGAVLLGTKREARQRTLDDGGRHSATTATKDLRSE